MISRIPLVDYYLVDIYSALGWCLKSIRCALPSRFLKLSDNHDLRLFAVNKHLYHHNTLALMANGVLTCCKYKERKKMTDMYN